MLPGMPFKDARVIYDLITHHKLVHILELGATNGVSTLHLVGSVPEGQGGHVVTISRNQASFDAPQFTRILREAGLDGSVELLISSASYNWTLMEQLHAGHEQTFDLCYIRSLYTWSEAGLAFYILKQLIRPGGWIVFANLDHTFHSSANHNSGWVLRMTQAERETPQLDRVFSLLTLRDSAFDTFRRIGKLGFARRRTVLLEDSAYSSQLEQSVYYATRVARSNPVARQQLLWNPSTVLTGISSSTDIALCNVLFRESGLWSPREPSAEKDGTLVHFLERPEWDKTFTEQQLLDMLEAREHA
jgi:predicted O-methyltransferase YrrM